jgi:hypothetical protein
VARLADTQSTSESASYSIRNPSLDPVGPVPVRFSPVEIVARGRTSTAVAGVQPADWVVTLGHHLLNSNDEGQAIVQPTPWEHILNLQEMQSRDLLDVIRQKQSDNEGRAQSLN